MTLKLDNNIYTLAYKCFYVIYEEKGKRNMGTKKINRGYHGIISKKREREISTTWYIMMTTHLKVMNEK